MTVADGHTVNLKQAALLLREFILGGQVWVLSWDLACCNLACYEPVSFVKVMS